MNNLLKHKEHIITNLEKENLFLKEQLRAFGSLVDQLTTTNRLSATKNDIRIMVENSSHSPYLRWWRKPRIILSGSFIVLLFSIYLRYKIKNW